MAPGQGEKLKLLLDVPESDILFGFDGYASTLASAILGTEPHFTGEATPPDLDTIATGLHEDWPCTVVSY